MLTGDNGILKRAGEAREKTDNAGTEEKIKMSVLATMTSESGQIKDATLRNELKNNLDGLSDSNITGNEKYGWLVKIENKGYSISTNGEVNEAFWEEIRDENGNIIEIRRIDGTVTGLKIGDIINYIATDGLDITSNDQMKIVSDKTTNGFARQQIDIRSYSGTWKLLGVEKGKVNVISSAVTVLLLKGEAAYQNVEEEINRICSFYGKGKYAESARSITVEDINKITGYDPNHTGVNVNKATAEQIETGIKYTSESNYVYGDKITYEWDGTVYPKYTSGTINGNLSYSHNTSPYNGFFWFDGKKWQKSNYTTTPKKICELVANYYSYYPETLTDINDTSQSIGIAHNSEEWKLIFDEEYLLASRCIDSAFSTGFSGFNVRRVGNGRVYQLALASTFGLPNGNGKGIRAIVTLKPDIQLAKDENGVWQFK